MHVVNTITCPICRQIISLLALLYLSRGIILALVRVLVVVVVILGGVLSLNNPAREPDLRSGCWTLLDDARREKVAADTDDYLQQGSILRGLANAFVDRVHHQRAQRVLVDFVVCEISQEPPGAG